MGRKNKNVRHAHDKDRRARQERKLRPAPPVVNIARVQVGDIVIPDGRCYRFSRKGLAIFGTEEKAARALAQAKLNRERSGSMHREKRYFACPEGGCGGFHLSSRDEDPGAR